MEPKCKYFGKCGGCSAQHIDYGLQLENKKKMLQSLIQFDGITTHHDEPYGYRNRMDFIFSRSGLGLRKKKDWRHIIDVDSCPISNREINKLLKEVREHFRDADSFDVNKRNGTYKYAVIRTPDNNSSISFILNEDSTKLAEAIEKIKQFAGATTADNIVIARSPSNTDVSISEDCFAVKGSLTLHQEVLDKTFKFHTQGFFQNNIKMAAKMLLYVKELLSKYDTEEAHLLDLYGGVGTFGIMNAENFKTTTIVEEFQGSIEIAFENVRLNKIKNTRTIAKDAKSLKNIELQQPLFVITDPPRSGMHPKALLQLHRLKPEVTIYISCNPKQAAKELQKLPDYEIKSAALFDLFPQTPHAELILELVRTS